MLRNLAKRSREHEIMDAGIDDFAMFDDSLRQIETVNRLTLGYRPVLSWLGAQMSAKTFLSVLDIGSGRGGLLRGIYALAKRKGAAVDLAGIDIAPWSAAAASKATPGEMRIDYRVNDVFRSDITADYIVCSHTTHHMTDAELVALIRWMEDHARRGWLIDDLHRHIIPYVFVKILLAFAPVNAMVRNDAAVSVARAFTRREWQALLDAAGVTAEIRWHFPFRYGVARLKDD